MRTTWGSALAALVVLAACDEDAALGPEDPALVLTLDAPEVIEVPFGGSLELTVHVRHADGTPATRYELLPITSCECATFAPLTGTGTERLTLTSSTQGYEWALQVRGKVQDSSFSSLSEPHWVLALRADATAVEAPVSEARLAIGERRPFVALATNRGRAVGTPTRFSLSNALASVDELGVVTALAAGQVVLTISAGTLSTDVALTIDPALAIGPPPQAAQRFTVPIEGNNVLTVGRGSRTLDHSMVLDRRGYPHALVSLGGRAALLTWTGTGFGFELLPDAWAPASPGTLAIDERDQLYVVGTAWSGAALFDKPASAPPSAWRKRALSQHVAALDRAGREFTRYVQGMQGVSMLPARGGGMEVLYAFRVGPVDYAYPCGIIYRHALATDDALALSDVTEDWGGPPSNSQCPTLTPRSFVLVRGASGGSELLLPYSNRLAPLNLYKGTGRFRRVSPTRWATDQAPELNKPGNFPVALPYVSMNAVAVANAGTLVFEGLASTSAASPYLFSAKGRVWLGDTEINSVLRLIDPFGIIGPDSPYAAFTASNTPGEEASQTVAWGAAADERAMHLLFTVPGRSTNELAYLSRRVPPGEVSTGTPEARGRFFEPLLSDGGVMSTIVSPPLSFADGTRAVLALGGSGVTSAAFSRVLRSGAVDEPWTARTPALLAQGTSLVERGGALYAVASGEQLACSVDRGDSWTLISASAATRTDATRQLINAPGGLAGDQGATLALWPSPGTTDAGLVTWTVPLFFNGHAVMPEPGFRSLFPGDGGVYFVAGLADSSRELYVARLRWDGSVANQLSTNTTTQYIQYLVRAGVSVSPSEVVFPSSVPASGSIRYLTNRVNLDTGAWGVGDAGVFSRGVPSLLALGDGGLVLAGTMSSRDLWPDGGLYHQERAVLSFSADGLTWSAPRVLRDEGGDLQEVQYLADDGRGGVLVVVLDSLLMTQTRPKQLLQRVVLP